MVSALSQGKYHSLVLRNCGLVCTLIEVILLTCFCVKLGSANRSWDAELSKDVGLVLGPSMRNRRALTHKRRDA